MQQEKRSTGRERLKIEKVATWKSHNMKKMCSVERAWYEERVNCKKCTWEHTMKICNRKKYNRKIIQHGKNTNYSKCIREIDHHQKRAKQIKCYMKEVQTERNTT